MKIGIDARILSVTKAGMGYYLHYILLNLFEVDSENEYYLFTKNKIDFDVAKYSNVNIIEDKSKLNSIAWYLFKLPFLLKKMSVNVFWGVQHILPLIKFKDIYYILTIHDLVLYEFPETMKTRNKIANRILLPKSIKDANKIIAVSNSTKEGLNKYFGKKINAKVEVIYESAVEYSDMQISEDSLNEKYSNLINEKYILYLGTIEPRKNIDVLLKSYEIIRENMNCKLILGGKMGWKSSKTEEYMKNHKYKNDIMYLGYVSDEEKYFLMKNCFVFVFPSIYEGFGLPVVEAMKCGAVSIIANNSSLKELISKDELKFKADDPKELANKIINLLENDNLYTEVRTYCNKRGIDFQWNEAAKRHKEVLLSNGNNS